MCFPSLQINHIHNVSSLHLLLLRFTGGSLQKRTLRLRRAPDDVVLGFIHLDPRAAGVRDHNGMLPIHLAAREGHGIGVINALLESFPGGSSEGDDDDAFPIDLALEYACQNAKKKKCKGEDSADDVEDEVDDPRWVVVKRLFKASPEVAQREGQKTVLLLRALSKSAPESIVRMLIPTAAQYFASRYGVNDASTALYVAIANQYPLDVMDQIVSICPVQTRSVRDETGMGLVAASYVVWAYGDGGGKKKDALSHDKDTVADNGSTNLLHWTKLKRHEEMVESLIEAQALASLDGPLSPPASISTTMETATNDGTADGFHNWWNKMKYWIQYYRPEQSFSGALLPGSVEAFPEHLLHAALSNPDTPPPVVFILLRLDLASAASPSIANDRLPIHTAVVASPYTARHYEENRLPHSTTELVYRAHPAAVRVRDPVTNRLPLHLALWNGQKTWSQGIATLVEAEPRALKVKDWLSQCQNKENEDGGNKNESSVGAEPTGLYPFQLAAVTRPRTTEMKLRLAYQARNRFSNAQWRGMSARQKATEINEEEASHELDVLTTVFELLRSEPSAVSDKKDERGTVVKLLAMRWGAKAAKPISAGARSPKKRCTVGKASPFPSSATPTGKGRGGSETGGEVHVEGDGDLSDSLRRSFSDFSEDSFGLKTSNASALQFNVNSMGQGTVTEMPSNAAFDVSTSIQEEQSRQLTLHAGRNTSDTTSPSTADGATPTGTALLSPEWFGNTAILSPQSQEPVASPASSTDPVPQGFVDPHMVAAGDEGKAPKKKSPWFKVRSFNKSRRSASGNDDRSATNDIPQEFDVADGYFCSSFSPDKAHLASRLNQGAIYNDWMKAYNVDCAEEEETRVLDVDLSAPDFSNTTAARPRLRVDTGASIADASSRGMPKDTDGGMLCVACSKSQSTALCLPCRHLSLCSGCAKGNKTGGCCPLCKRAIVSIVDVFY